MSVVSGPPGVQPAISQKQGSTSWREYMQWMPDPPSEPTSTLVLTSPARRIVDIRILKPTSPNEPELPNEGGPMSRLDWAIAGVSRSTPITLPSGQPVLSCEWAHWINSRAGPFNDSDTVDKGLVAPHPDDPALALETGSMVNPATGIDTEYEECWRDEDVDGAVVVLELRETDDQGREIGKGLVIRVGDWCQGIIKVVSPSPGGGWDSELSLERWKREASGQWAREAKLGRLWLPCAVTWEGSARVGGEVSYEGFVWKTVEVEGQL